MSAGLDDLYNEHILDHFESPYHKGTCPGATCRHAERNPICGDQIELQLDIAPEGQVRAAWFEGRGCAISQAGASLLCEHIEGRSTAELQQMTARQMLDLLQVPLTASRQKCGLLAFKVLKTLLYSREQAPSTNGAATAPTAATPTVAPGASSVPAD